MRINRWTLLALVGSLTPGVLGAETDPMNDLEQPFRVMVNGEAIDVGIGHAAPLVTDWDNDGLADLLVGQFEGAHLRVYRNVGSADAPIFQDFALFETRKKLGSIPSG